MAFDRRVVRGAWAALLIALFAMLPAPARGNHPEQVQLLVIVAKNSSLENISMTDLRRAYTGERMTAPGGQRLLPLQHPPKTPHRVGFDRAVLGMSPEEVARYWIDRKIRGGSGPSRAIDNPTLIPKVVERLSGAVAYVPAGRLINGVRAVKVDGKRPDEPGYPLWYTR